MRLHGRRAGFWRAPAWPRAWRGIVLLLALLPGLGAGAPARADGVLPPFPGLCSESDRFGVWEVRHGIQAYDVDQLHLGWYNAPSPAARPARPGGIGYVQLVRVSVDGPYPGAACSRCPTWEEVSRIVYYNPGSLWLIGNEPDRQDHVNATRYAQIYHDFYLYLKAEDPACQVAIGGVVQATPIRLQYLGMILDAYLAQYGEPMPIDVWNVHNYVLREGVDGWGCGIPPGTDPDLAIEYTIQDHDNMEYWTGHLLALRQFMHDRGYGNTPLIVSEWGILMPDFYGFDYERVRTFMLATLDWMRTTTDPDLGYEPDGDRLVQAWSWYSLDDSSFEHWPTWSHLFDPDTKTISDLGLDLGAYTEPLSLPNPGMLDLQVTSLKHGLPEVGPGGLFTVTLSAGVHNGGAKAAENVGVRFARDGVPVSDETIPLLMPGESTLVEVTWSGLAAGPYEASVWIDPEGQLVECDRSNNQQFVSIFPGALRSYLPLLTGGR